MSLDLSKVGSTTQAYAFDYDWKNLATYALGIGAKRDELAYLYENAKGGMKAYPTFGVVPAFAAVIDLLTQADVNLAMVVHGAQKVVAHRPIPDHGAVSTTGTLRGVYDLKKFAQLVIDTHSTLGGEKLFDTTWSIIVRGAGGFEGPRPPEAEPEPTVPKDRPADFTFEEATTPEQALLYRISGDVNPLHADPDFATAVGFPQGPILHGLATYGFVARAAVKHAAAGDAGKLRVIAAQFRKPVWPGDTLITQGWDVGDGKWALAATVKGRPEAILSNAWAQFG